MTHGESSVEQAGFTTTNHPSWRACLLARLDPGLAVVLLFPLALLLVYKSWIITFPAHLDPWYSLGYFLHLPEYLSFAPTNYASSRLAYWLPGHALFSLLAPLAANYALRLCYYWVAAGSLYLILTRALGRRVGLTAALLLGSYWHFLREIGWNYVDGAGIAYYLLTLFILTPTGLGRPGPGRLFVAGVAFAAAINTNFFLITTTPLLVLYVVLTHRGGSWRGHVLAAVSFLAGGTLLLASLCLYCYVVAGDLLLPLSQVNTAVRIYNYSGPTIAFLGYEVPPLLEWVPRAYWLRLPLVVLVGSCLTMVLALWCPAYRAPGILSFQVLYVCQFLGMAVLQPRTRDLIIPWYASYLIPHLFLALGGQVALALRSLSRASAVAVLAGGVAALLLLFRLAPTCCAGNVSMDLGEFGTPGWAVPCSFAALAVSLALLIVTRGRPGSLQPWLLGSFLTSVAVFNYSFAARDASHAWFKKDSFLAIARGVRAIDTARTDLNSLHFWFKVSDLPSYYLYYSLTSVYLHHNGLHNDNFPSLAGTRQAVRLPAPGTLIVLLSRERGLFEQAQTVLRKAGVEARLVNEAEIRQGALRYTIALLRTEEPTSSTSARR